MKPNIKFFISPKANIKILIALACTILPLRLGAQTETSDTDFDFQSYTSVSADWKVCNGLHLQGGYELRATDNLSRIGRQQVNVGIEWSPIKSLDIGGGYSYIGNYDSKQNLKPRNRFYADITGGYKFGRWKLSLKERMQLTHKSYEINEFQQTPNLLELRSRLKLSYKGLKHLEPYSYVELRNCFNAPSFTCDYDQQNGKYINYEFLGYNDMYLNRVRAVVGLQWEIDNHNALDFRLMSDWCYDKDIDTNAEGTKLKSFICQKSIECAIAVGYVFSF